MPEGQGWQTASNKTAGGPQTATDLVRLHRKRAEISERIREVTEEIVSVARQISERAGKAGRSRIPAVPVEGSVSDGHIACLFDGLKLKDLGPHLREAHGMTPEEYRLHFFLPDDYPTAAPVAEPPAVAGVRRTKPPVSGSHYGPGSWQKRLGALAEEALWGLDKIDAVKKALSGRRTPLTTHQVAGLVLKQNKRDSSGDRVAAVSRKLPVVLYHMADRGEVEKLGDSGRREWRLRRL